MIVRNHRLCQDDGTPVPFRPSPNIGAALRMPSWLVMHYTADQGNAAVNWFLNPVSKVSAHLVIAREGTIVQMVPFDRIAYHAGKSAWKGITGLNVHSIGIELVNLGKLSKRGGRWVASQGADVDPRFVIEAEGAGWHTYTPAQMAAAKLAARALVNAYGLDDVLGHSEIAPGRKEDPGPAFPMSTFRKEVMSTPAPKPVTPAAPALPPLAKAIVEERWNRREKVSAVELRTAVATLRQMLAPAVLSDAEGAKGMDDTLKAVQAFYAKEER